MPKVVLTEHLDDEAREWLAARVELVGASLADPEGLRAALADAEGLVVRTYTVVDRRLLDAAPRLRVVGRAGVGLDNVDLEACRERGVAVVCTPGANTEAVVEYVFAVVLDSLRPRGALPHAADAEEFHRRRRAEVGTQLDSLTLGILGMGRIGRRVARVAHAFGARVLANDLLTRPQLGLAADHPGEFVAKPRLWAESDVLTLHADGRPENRGLIGRDVLRQVKPTLLLVNTARGMIVDAAALAEWARTVERAGGAAVLDVHEPEPPPGDYPLWGLPNVRILPHLASRTRQALRAMSWVVRDVVRVLQGEAPEHPAW